MNYELAIFDFDGTLADTYSWFTGVVNSIAQKYHFKQVDPSEHESLRGYDAHQMLKYLGVSLWKMPMIANHLRALMAQDIHHISLFEGMDELLPLLSHAGVTLAVVSSNSYDNVQQVLGAKNAGLINYYECGVSIFGKDSRLRKILKKSGILHSKAIYIGDEIRDVESAKNVHVSFGGVAWGYNTAAALEARAPNEMFYTVAEIGEKIV